MKNLNQFSLFPSIRSPKSEIVTLADFIESIRTPRFETPVHTYRRLMAEGRKAEANEVKRRLPAACVAATCENGHSLPCIRVLSGFTSIDLDNTGDHTESIFAQLCELPYVVAVFRTVSGQGLKVIILIEAGTVEEYRQAYARVSAEVARIVAHEVDKQCKDITRLCFVSNDPLAFFRPEAEVFPWRTEPDGEGQGCPAGDVPSPAPGDEEFPPFSDAQAEAFLEEFLQWNPFVNTHRHERMLKLGRKAASKNFSSEEIENLIQTACRKLAQPDYDGTSMRKDILAGYQYVETRKENPRVPSSTLKHVAGDEEGYAKVDLLEKNRDIQVALPYFSEQIYQRLPDLLKRAVSPVRRGRESDFLLMAVLANLSTCLPQVNLRYDNLDYSCHLFFAAVGSTASGKGVVAHASGISYPLHQHLVQQSAQAHKEYKRQLRRYQLELQQAVKAGKEFDKEEPVEPPRLMVQIPGNCSKSSLVRALGDNEELGLVINASEINTLVSVMGLDYGKMDDLFCAATHHEEYGRSFVKDGETFWIDKTRLAFCLSGTLKQFIDLVRSPENGFASRISALTAQSQCAFHSCEPREDTEDLRTFLRSLGEEVLEMYSKLVLMPDTRIHFTHEQWERHAAHFHNILLTVRFECEEDVNAVVYRFALLCMRIAAIFTVLRKWEDQIFAADRYCSEEDFESALAMTDVLLAHTLQLSTLFPPVPKKPLSQYNKVLNAIRDMSNEFTFTEFEKTMFHQNVPRTTCWNWLQRAVKFKFVELQGDKYRKTLR